MSTVRVQHCRSRLFSFPVHRRVPQVAEPYQLRASSLDAVAS